jgi:hypothetical protein
MSFAKVRMNFIRAFVRETRARISSRQVEREGFDEGEERPPLSLTYLASVTM